MVWKKKEIPEEIDYGEPTSAPKKKIEGEVVVSELPQMPIRQARGDDGAIYKLITQNEAMKEVLEGIRELLKRTE